MSNLYCLSDAQMERLKPCFPKSRGKPRVDERRVLSGIVFFTHNGLRWAMRQGIRASQEVIITAVARKLVTIANALCKSRQKWSASTS